MARWTEEQERVLREAAHMGAAECAGEIFARTGVRRSEQSVRMHASRMGLSMVRFSVCPCCGSNVRSLHRTTGLCAACNAEYRAKAQREEHDRIELELRRSDAEKEERRKRAVREYKRWNMRARRLAADRGGGGESEVPACAQRG